MGYDPPKGRAVVFYDNIEFVMEVHKISKTIYRDIVCC